MIGTDFKPGDLVTWRYVAPGGWGYVFPVPARVIGFGRGRVKIEAQKADGTTAVRFVKPESLKLRTE